ncbi:MAG: amidohydrolase [Gemmatimonadales bacterium]|nr:amidohydrolase [Gemmatimonadales bacterium]
MNHENGITGTARWNVGVAAVFLLGLSVAGAQTQEEALLSRMTHRLEGAREELIALRRDIHRHPEVSGREERTAGVVAARLQSLGLEVQTGVGGHGVVGILRGARPGPVVAFRADMDAVSSDAPDPVPFASEIPGVRHICGHDIHTTVAVGIAEAMTAIRDQLPGTVKFIFQPAEENVQGAAAMIREGVLENPAPAAIFAFHSAPLTVGQIGSVEGLALPGLDRFTAALSGADTLEQSARIAARAFYALGTPGDIPPSEYIRVMISGVEPRADGEAWAVTGLVRVASAEARTRAQEGIERALAELRGQGLSTELSYETLGVLPDMVNDPELVRSTLEAIRSAVGPEGLLEINEVTPQFSEDFAYYQQHIPGAMYWLGVANSELGYNGLPHSPDFAADEEAIFVGARAMAAVLLDYLEKH